MCWKKLNSKQLPFSRRSTISAEFSPVPAVLGLTLKPISQTLDNVLEPDNTGLTKMSEILLGPSIPFQTFWLVFTQIASFKENV